MAVKKRKPESKRVALFVLGMHRSGTSALSGLLSLLGAAAPRTLMAPTKDNPRGYFESTEIMKANDRILSSAGSRWNDWGPFNPDWFDSGVAAQFREQLPALVEREFGDAPLLLIKDPRICRFFPFWQESLAALDIDSRVVIPLRHPLEVARSLEARDKFGRNRSLLLWLRHKLDAEAASRGTPRTFVRYESVIDDWKGVGRKIEKALGLKWAKWSGDTEMKIEEFLSPEHKHFEAEEALVLGDGELARWTEQVHHTFMALADGNPADRAALATLDGIRAEFDRTARIYAAVVREHETRVEGLYANVKAQLAERAQQLEATTARANEAGNQLQGERKALAEHKTSLATLAEQQAARDRALEALRSRLAAAEAERTQLAANLAATFREHEVRLEGLQASIALQVAEKGKAAAAEVQAVNARLAAREAELAAAAREYEVRLEGMQASLRSQVHEKAHQLELLQARHDEAGRKLEAEGQAAAAERARAIALAAQLAERELEGTRAAEKLAAKEADFLRLVEQRRLDIESLKSRLADREGEVTRLSAELVAKGREYEVRLDGVRASLQAQLDERARHAAQLSEARDALEAQLAESSRTAFRLHEELQAHAEALAERSAERDAGQAQLAAAVAEGRDLRERLAAGEAEVAALREQLHEVEADAASAREALDETTQALRAAGEELARRERRIGDLDGDIDRLQTALADVGTERDAFAESLAETGEQLGALLGRLADATSERDALAERLADATTDRDALAERLADTITQRDALAENLAAREAAATQLHAQLEQAQQAHAAAQATVEALTRDLADGRERRAREAAEAASRLSAQKEGAAAAAARHAAELKDVREALAKAQAEVDVRFKEIAKLTTLVLEADQAKDAEAQRRVLLEFERAVRNATAGELAHQAHLQRQQLDLVRRSRVWRWTKPFHAELPEVPATVDWGKQLELLRGSALFDREWYVAQYPDVLETGLDPVDHYLRRGAMEGRNPSPAFDTLAYLSRYPDVRESAINPLAHYEEYGRSENRVVAAVETGRA